MNRVVNSLNYIAGIGGVLSSFAAAFLWWYASVLEVPDNIDTFIEALQEISRWNSRAAIASGIAAVCLAFTFTKEHWL
jgi:hypothetical protein